MKRLRNEVPSFTRAPLPQFEERLRSLCQRKGRPVFHGEIALEMGCSLEHVSREMETLVDAGKFRLVAANELKARAIESRVIAYAVVR